MVLKIAHRGAPKEAPPNSIEALKKAVELGADIVEFDVRRSKDNFLVVFHDFILVRNIKLRKSITLLVKKLGLISRMNLEELKSIVLKNNEHIPTIEEAIFAIKRAHVKIDIKKYCDSNKLVQLIKENGLESRSIITGNIDIAKEIKKVIDDVKIELTFKRRRFRRRLSIQAMMNQARSHGVDIISPHHTLINEELIKNAHSNGFQVNAWTVNDISNIERLKTLGVDTITTDIIQLI